MKVISKTAGKKCSLQKRVCIQCSWAIISIYYGLAEACMQLPPEVAQGRRAPNTYPGLRAATFPIGRQSTSRTCVSIIACEHSLSQLTTKEGRVKTLHYKNTKHNSVHSTPHYHLASKPNSHFPQTNTSLLSQCPPRQKSRTPSNPE